MAAGYLLVFLAMFILMGAPLFLFLWLVYRRRKIEDGES